MKKLIIVGLSIMLIMTGLTACGKDSNDSTNIEESNNKNIEFWTDEETGVQYVIYERTLMRGAMGGITPRLNADGSIYVVD